MARAMAIVEARSRHLAPSTEVLLEECRDVLGRHYGRRLAGLLLYGSTARREQDAESDIDLLVLLTGDFDYFAELRTIIALLEPLQLESERLISARPAAVEAVEEGRINLYRNALEEGIRL
jgi:predicted nucleotidyltransferase